MDLKIHPLTHQELGDVFNIEKACQFGTLPQTAQRWAEGDEGEARSLLRSYATTYVKEEIQAEALTRNVGAFQRFLQVAAQDNARVIEFANLSRECLVPSSTLKEYYSILEDTLLGDFLWPWDKSGCGEISLQTVKAFRARFGEVPLIVASLQDFVPRRLEFGVEVLPWAQALKRYQSL